LILPVLFTYGFMAESVEA